MNSCVTFCVAAAQNGAKSDRRGVSAFILADTDLIRAPGVDSDARFKPGVEHSTPAVRALAPPSPADPLLRLRSTPFSSRRRAPRSCRERGKFVQNERVEVKPAGILLTFELNESSAQTRSSTRKNAWSERCSHEPSQVNPTRRLARRIYVEPQHRTTRILRRHHRTADGGCFTSTTSAHGGVSSLLAFTQRTSKHAATYTRGETNKKKQRRTCGSGRRGRPHNFLILLNLCALSLPAGLAADRLRSPPVRSAVRASCSGDVRASRTLFFFAPRCFRRSKVTYLGFPPRCPSRSTHILFCFSRTTLFAGGSSHRCGCCDKTRDFTRRRQRRFGQWEPGAAIRSDHKPALVSGVRCTSC